ncbi:hypothetical protein L1047_05255 [Synechococcus sp. Nb3U1]|uniref:hypothetical protein n=1 Tax=Synechococcus sp. Nb3U1 TaxID=1914529 RepID=UPI001F3310E6|nr:hypothetical protein [Synechococcus sp. Nb3U1]MCF2970601.1 hypothetical protein [Synechococcus sp. Nb3U1]
MGTTDRSLAALWAQKYVKELRDQASPIADPNAQLAQKVKGSLRFASSQAWAKTEQLLAAEITRHRLDPDLIDPWQIADDSQQLFEKAAESYQEQLPPERFSAEIATPCGQLRARYTRPDPRVLGFMSMQFHYTGQGVLQALSAQERSLFYPYLKVMDDHLYMPLQRSYEAAAHAGQTISPPLAAVQELLPVITQVAESICGEVAQRFSDYRSESGLLTDVEVRISSIRDVEMFQVYLGLCTLEGSVAAVQQELFPLCVMLYPALKVSWNLVRQMLELLDESLHFHLTPPSYDLVLPYLRAIQDMFSLEVFPEDDPIWSHHPDVVRFMGAARDLLQELLNQQAS